MRQRQVVLNGCFQSSEGSAVNYARRHGVRRNILNQLQDLPCFRCWEFRSLGDLEKSSKRLNDSKTPKLQAAKAMSVQWQRGMQLAPTAIGFYIELDMIYAKRIR